MKKYRNKGMSLDEFPNSFCVLDLETTGFNPKADAILEIGLIKVVENKIVDSYTSLIKPPKNFIDDTGKELYIDTFLENLTGITNDELETAPTLIEVSDTIKNFIASDIIVGHNVNFDINFLYDFFLENYSFEFSNDFWDMLKISKRVLPELKHHRLSDIANFFKYDFIGHRALNDCKATFDLMMYLKKFIEVNDLNIYYKRESMYKFEKLVNNTYPNIFSLLNNFEINSDGFFYEKNICFTGALRDFSRSEAIEICQSLGARNQNSVTKSTDILVVGSYENIRSIKNGKSLKQKRAEELILLGQDLCMLDEQTFIDKIFEDFGELYE